MNINEYKFEHKIQYYETDKMGITHHSNYIRFMEEARTDFLEKIGWGYDKMEEIGIVSPVINVYCEYKKTTTYNDIIQVFIKIEKISVARLTLRYEMKLNDEVVCNATSSHCFLDKKSVPINLKKYLPEFYEVLGNLKEFNEK